MKFLRINMDNQFAPSNFDSSILDESSGDSSQELAQTVDAPAVRFAPMPKFQRKQLSGKNKFQAIHIESNNINEFKIPEKPKLNPPAPRPSVPRTNHISNVDVEVRQEHQRVQPMPKPVEFDYNQFNYEHIELKPQTKLLWSGSHWQIEKLLMDISFAKSVCINVDETNEIVIRTVNLNNGQDGSFKEYISKKLRKVTEIQYNYPDQSIDEHSSIAFSFRKVGQLYYIVIVITDFTVTLDAPINPQRFCVEYLKRVLATGGTFAIDK